MTLILIDASLSETDWCIVKGKKKVKEPITKNVFFFSLQCTNAKNRHLPAYANSTFQVGAVKEQCCIPLNGIKEPFTLNKSNHACYP